MTKKDLNRLLNQKDVMDRVIGLLVSMGYVEKTVGEIARLVLTDKAKAALDFKENKVNEEFVKSYRSLFPTGKKGDANMVSQNLSWLLSNYGYSEDQILKATNNYLGTVDNKVYCQQADFFIYKTLPSGSIRNTILTFLEELGDTVSKEGEGYGCEVI